MGNVVYDGGGAIVASLGLEGQQPIQGPTLSHMEFMRRLEVLRVDFEAGLMSAEEFGAMCEEAAKARCGR